MKTPIHITFTGVDSFINPTDLKTLSSKYSIEWGVLIGGNPDKNRYPKLDVINTISQYADDNGLDCALHLCGPFAKQAQEGNIDYNINIRGFKRFQVNALQYDLDQLGKFADKVDKHIIYQHRKGEFKSDLHPKVFAIHDESGGKGKVPDSRPLPVDRLVGYAGGINLENVKAIVDSIPDGEYWIDMETSLRTNDKFDLDICESICRKIWN